MHRLLISVASRLPRFLALLSFVLVASWMVAGVAQAQGTPPPGYFFACREGERCVIGAVSRDVAYGVGPNQVHKNFAMTGMFDCNNASFGGDPARKQAKFCYIALEDNRRTGCAIAGAVCNVSGTQNVMYGVDGRYVSAQKSGSFVCDGRAFGNQDPAYGRVKACFIGAPR